MPAPQFENGPMFPLQSSFERSLGRDNLRDKISPSLVRNAKVSSCINVFNGPSTTTLKGSGAAAPKEQVSGGPSNNSNNRYSSSRKSPMPIGCVNVVDDDIADVIEDLSVSESVSESETSASCDYIYIKATLSGDGDENEISNLTVVDYSAIPEDRKKTLSIGATISEEPDLQEIAKNNVDNKDTTQASVGQSGIGTFNVNNTNRPSSLLRNSKVSSFIHALNGGTSTPKASASVPPEEKAVCETTEDDMCRPSLLCKSRVSSCVDIFNGPVEKGKKVLCDTLDKSSGRPSFLKNSKVSSCINVFNGPSTGGAARATTYPQHNNTFMNGGRASARFLGGESETKSNFHPWSSNGYRKSLPAYLNSSSPDESATVSVKKARNSTNTTPGLEALKQVNDAFDSIKIKFGKGNKTNTELQDELRFVKQQLLRVPGKAKTQDKEILEAPEPQKGKEPEIANDESENDLVDKKVTVQDLKKHVTEDAQPVPHPGDTLKANPLGSLSVPFDKVYKLGDVINEGAFGVVYKAHHRSLKSTAQVAVKIVDRIRDDDDEHDEEEDNKILSETSILRDVRDIPCIVKLFDFYMDDDKFYIVQELAAGGDVFDRLLDKEYYTECDARDLAQILFKMIDNLHRYGIIHRDLKPENLLLKNVHDDTAILLCDFGYAKYLPDTGASEYMNGRERRKHGHAGLTTFCGTPCFTAPEVLEEMEYYEEVDMWSIGCILFMLLSGYRPFEEDEENGESELDLFEYITTADYDFDDPVWDVVSKEAKDLISNLLVLDRNKRLTACEALEHGWFSTTAEFQTTLESHDLIQSGVVTGIKHYCENIRPPEVYHHIDKDYVGDEDYNYLVNEEVDKEEKENNEMEKDNTRKVEREKEIALEKEKEKASEKEKTLEKELALEKEKEEALEKERALEKESALEKEKEKALQKKKALEKEKALKKNDEDEKDAKKKEHGLRCNDESFRSSDGIFTGMAFDPKTRSLKFDYLPKIRPSLKDNYWFVDQSTKKKIST